MGEDSKEVHLQASAKSAGQIGETMYVKQGQIRGRVLDQSRQKKKKRARVLVMLCIA